MRICYLCPDLGIPLNGHKGASAHVRGVVKAFREAGHELQVITGAAYSGSDIGVPVMSINIPEIAESACRHIDKRMTRALRHLWSNVAIENALSDVIDKFKPDLIYERYSPFSVAGGRIAGHRSITHVLEVNSPLAREGAQYRNQALPDIANSLEKSTFDATSLIVAVSDDLRDELVEAGVETNKIAVVPNGVDISLFASPEPKSVPELSGRFVIGFIGSLKPWHGIEILADAFRKLASDKRFHLLVVGDGPSAKVLEKLEQELPCRVTRIGAVSHEDVVKYLHAMDVAVAPYPLIDNFYFSPLKVLEYMAAGRAVVASDIGQLRYLIRDGETGILLPPGDSEALACTLRSLSEDRGRCLQLGMAAEAEAREHHAWSQRVTEILARVDNDAAYVQLAI